MTEKRSFLKSQNYNLKVVWMYERYCHTMGYRCLMCGRFIRWWSTKMVKVQLSPRLSSPPNVTFLRFNKEELATLVVCETCLPGLMEHQQPEGEARGRAITMLTRLTLHLPDVLHATLWYDNKAYVVAIEVLNRWYLTFYLPPGLEPTKHAELHVLMRHDGMFRSFSRRFILRDGCSTIGTNGYPVQAAFVKYARHGNVGDKDVMLLAVAKRLERFAKPWDWKADKTRNLKEQFLICTNRFDFYTAKGVGPQRWQFANPSPPWFNGPYGDLRLMQVWFERNGYGFATREALQGHKWFRVTELLHRWAQISTLEKVLNRHWDAIQDRLWKPNGLMAARGWREIQSTLNNA